mgnify:CR=1 FL=1
MHSGYEGLGVIGLLIPLAMIVIGLCITIAPLIIWRNGNRTNRMLALIALQQGIPADKIKDAFSKGGGDLPKAIYDAEKISNV